MVSVCTYRSLAAAGFGLYSVFILIWYIVYHGLFGVSFYDRCTGGGKLLCFGPGRHDLMPARGNAGNAGNAITAKGARHWDHSGVCTDSPNGLARCSRAVQPDGDQPSAADDKRNSMITFVIWHSRSAPLLPAIAIPAHFRHRSMVHFEEKIQCL